MCAPGAVIGALYAGGMFVRAASGGGRSVDDGGSGSDGSESDQPGSSSTSSRGGVEALDDAAGSPAVPGSLRAEMDIEAVGRSQKVGR
jgi:hypothetical protein